MEKREDDLVVGGYRFATVADAETARMEIKKVENLEPVSYTHLRAHETS